MKYDAVFIEKECMSGLTVDEITRMYDLLNQNEGFPMEIYNTGAESSAIGFITPSGFNTKYYLLIADDIASLAAAQTQANDLNQKYGDILTKCEDTGDWTAFPFTDKPIIFYK